MERNDLAAVIAANAAELKYEDIPLEVVEVTKRSILDTLGSVIAAGTIGMEGCKEIMELAVAAGGKPESTLIGSGEKMPSWMAAFANGALSHGVDYDDALDSGFIHPSITTVPAALAMAEHVGKVPGKELIAAIALGNDLIVRLGTALIRHPGGYAREWRPSAVFGTMCGALACGRILKLDKAAMADALGIAFTQSAGTLQTSFGAATIRSLYPAFVGKQSVLCALMAQKGITGTQEPLEGRAGLFNVYYDGTYDRDLLIGDLGKRFEGTQASFKPWPSCRVSHAYIDATLTMMEKYHIVPENIMEVMLYVGDKAQPLCEPPEVRRRPRTVSEAKFSIPFIVASTIVRGSPVIGHLTQEGITDAATLEMAKKVSYQYAVKVDRRDLMPPARVDITDCTGKVYSETIDTAYGNPQKPISTEDLVSKFIDCVQYARKPISKENQEKAIAMLLNLENVENTGEIIALLS